MGLSIIPSARTPWDVISEKIGQNISQNLPGAVERGYNRGLLQESLGKIKDLASNPNASNLDLMLAAMQAGAGIPGSEKYIGQIMPEIIKQANAMRSQQTYPGGTKQAERVREPLEPMPERRPLPTFQNVPQKEQFFPTNQPLESPIGQAPQAATSGVKEKLLTPQEIIDSARDLARASTQAGNPLEVKDAIPIIQSQENQKILHNQRVDEELNQKIASQERYGTQAVKELEKVLPNATSEQQAIFKKKGEEASRSGDSEADIHRYLAKEAVKFKNAIANAEKDIDAPRLLDRITKGFNGTYKNFEEAGSDVRKHLQPLLDMGLYDTANNILAKKSYGPEEREMILNPLSPRAKSILQQLPKTPRELVSAGPQDRGVRSQRSPDMPALADTLRELKKADPNFSLPLARKMAEDKDYTWREFKDTLNMLIDEGMELTDYQKNQLGVLDSPPLTTLEKFLHGLNLIGR